MGTQAALQLDGIEYIQNAYLKQWESTFSELCRLEGENEVWVGLLCSGLPLYLPHTWLLPGSLHKYLTGRLCLLALLFSRRRLGPNLMSQ